MTHADRPAPPAVLTATNLNGLAVARALGRHGVRAIGIHSEDGPELRSRYLRELWRVEPGPDARLAALLARAEGLGDRPVLFPITDESVRLVALNLEQLGARYRIAITDPDLVLRLLSKKGIHEVASRLEVAAPRTWVIDQPSELEELAAELPFPVVVKPQVRSDAFARAAGRKAALCHDVTALLETYGALRDVEPRVVVQQFVPGGDRQVYFCLQYIGRDLSPLGSVTGRKLRQWPPDCGGTASCEVVDEPELEARSTGFFRGAGLWGLCSTEFKRDPRDGAFYLIEPTVGRTDWQNGLADHNGVPLAYLAYRDLVELPAVPVRRTRLRWRWVHFGADRLAAAHHRRRGELGWIGWLWSLRPPIRGAYWAWDDPGPFLRIFGSTVRRGWRKLMRTIGLGASNG